MQSIHASLAEATDARENAEGIHMPSAQQVIEFVNDERAVDRRNLFRMLGGVAAGGAALFGAAAEAQGQKSKTPNAHREAEGLTLQQKVTLRHATPQELEQYREENTKAWLKHIYEGGEEAWKKTLKFESDIKHRRSYTGELYAFLDKYKRRYPNEEGYPEWTENGRGQPGSDNKVYIYQLVSGKNDENKSGWFVILTNQVLGDRYGKLNPKGVFLSEQYKNLEDAVSIWSAVIDKAKRQDVALKQ